MKRIIYDIIMLILMIISILFPVIIHNIDNKPLIELTNYRLIRESNGSDIEFIFKYQNQKNNRIRLFSTIYDEEKKIDKNFFENKDRDFMHKRYCSFKNENFTDGFHQTPLTLNNSGEFSIFCYKNKYNEKSNVGCGDNLMIIINKELNDEKVYNNDEQIYNIDLCPYIGGGYAYKEFKSRNDVINNYYKKKEKTLYEFL